MSRLLPILPAILALVCGPSASATVIYSGLKNLAIPANFDGVYLDVDAGVTGAAEFTGWDINPFFGGDGVANSPAFQPARTGTANSDPIVRLNAGDLISAGRLFSTDYGGSDSHLGNAGNQFAIGQEGYLGFKLTTNGNAGPYYGWMRVAFTANTSGAVIKDWAYETTASATTAGRILEGAPASGVQTVALSGGSGETYALGSQLADHGGNATAVLKTGAGGWTLTGNDNFTGTTTVNAGILDIGGTLSATSALTVGAGGALRLSGGGGVNSKLNTAATLTLDGGTFGLGGMTGSLDQQLGTLSLADNSILDFGLLPTGETIRFGNSSGQTWAAGRTLSIWNYTGAMDHFYVGTNSFGLTTTQLSEILFFSDSGTSLLAPAGYSELLGEVVPVPEPSTWFAGLGILGMIGWLEWRRSRRLRAMGAQERSVDRAPSADPF